MKNIIKTIEPRLISTLYKLPPRYKRNFLGKRKMVVPEAWYKPGEKEPANIEPANNFLILDEADQNIAYLFESGKEIYEENGELKVKRFTFLDK